MLNEATQKSTQEVTLPTPAGNRTVPTIVVQAKNYDENGELNENFIRDDTYLLSDANYFGCNAEVW